MGERKYLVTQEELTRAIEEAETIGIPFSQKGAANGVATLNASEELTSSQVPVSVVNSSAVGFAPSVIWLDTTPEFYGAKGDGVTNDTAAFQLCSEAVKASGSGTVRLSAKTYVVDGLIWEPGVSWEGRGAKSVGGTILKALSGSSNEGQIMIGTGAVNQCGWRGVCFEGAGNASQDCFYLHAQESGGVGGVWNATFEDLYIGGNVAFSRNGMWFRAGTANSKTPHQFNAFRNVTINRPTTGAQATTARCLKLTGQCEKFEYDTACTFNGVTAGERVGTNVELSREFLLATTITAEVAAGKSVIEVASTTGLEASKKFSLGEGATNEVCQVESISGLKVTLKKALAYTHANGANLYLLAGTVAAPTTLAPSKITFQGGTAQTADLNFLIDAAYIVDVVGTDCENSHRMIRVREGAFQVNVHGPSVALASEGKSRGTGLATVGSETITEATGAWVEGELIAGAGIPFGTTVTTVAGSAGALTLTLSAKVEANGAAGAQSIPLTGGGRGEGYIASYESKSQGVVSYYITGAADRSVLNSESSVIVRDLARSQPLAIYTSSGLTLALGTAASLTIYAAREVELTNATTPITTILGQHATGETVTFRAQKAGKLFETGGNIGALPASGSLTLESGDSATFQRTDRGSTTWVLTNVQRATEPGAELVWKEIEELNTKLELAPEYAPHVQCAVATGIAYLMGAVKAKSGEEVTGSSTIFKLPTTARPETKRSMAVFNSEGKYTTITISPSGNVAVNQAVKSTGVVAFDNAYFRLKP